MVGSEEDLARTAARTDNQLPESTDEERSMKTVSKEAIWRQFGAAIDMLENAIPR